MIFDKLFSRHLASVGESYGEHCRHALGFSCAMFAAGLACLVHAFIPGLFERSASRIITRLGDRMVNRRPGPSAER